MATLLRLQSPHAWLRQAEDELCFQNGGRSHKKCSAPSHQLPVTTLLFLFTLARRPLNNHHTIQSEVPQEHLLHNLLCIFNTMSTSMYPAQLHAFVAVRWHMQQATSGQKPNLPRAGRLHPGLRLLLCPTISCPNNVSLTEDPILLSSVRHLCVFRHLDNVKDVADIAACWCGVHAGVHSRISCSPLTAYSSFRSTGVTKMPSCKPDSRVLIRPAQSQEHATRTGHKQQSGVESTTVWGGSLAEKNTTTEMLVLTPPRSAVHQWCCMTTI